MNEGFVSLPDLIHLMRDFIDGFLSSVLWRGLDEGGLLCMKSLWGLFSSMKLDPGRSLAVSVTGTEGEPCLRCHMEL